MPPTTTPSDGGRRKPGAVSPATLSDASWQVWWSIHEPFLLPRPELPSTRAEGGYAASLGTELRRAVDRLIQGMADPDPQVRQAAAGSFAGFTAGYRAGEVLEALRRGARASDPWLRDVCHLGLGLRRDLESVSALRRVALDRREPETARAFAALAWLQASAGRPDPKLLTLTEDLDSPALAGAILIALGTSREPTGLPTIVEAARRRTGAAGRVRRVRIDALTALGRLGHGSTAQLLVELLDDDERSIARSAAIALGGFHEDPAVARALAATLVQAEDPWLRALSAVSLGRVGHEGMPALAQALRTEPNTSVIPFVALGVGISGVAGAERTLDALLAESPRAGGFGTAALSIGLLGAHDRGSVLAKALLDETNTVAPGCAAVGLGLLQVAATATVMRDRFWFDSARLRPGFHTGLRLIDSGVHATWVRTALERARRGGERRALVEALGTCGGAADVAALLAVDERYGAADTRLRVAVLGTLAKIVRGGEPTWFHDMLCHTYYLNANDTFDHLGALP